MYSYLINLLGIKSEKINLTTARMILLYSYFLLDVNMKFHVNVQIYLHKACINLLTLKK